ncbi:hypothetical protein [Wolbachia endosymbiont of Rhagoletis cingulata]|uniref:hypothetical protein n=1 Tax=Wolbachia endosymbiont of Rhagoletis cingulata TaxID=1220542 RepID=UPI003AF3F904
MEEVHDYGRKVHYKIATVATMNFQRAGAFYENLGMSVILYVQAMLMERHVYF